MARTAHQSLLANKPLRLQHLLEAFSVIIVPGLRNSDENHWQSLWQAQVPHSKRIQLDNWETPDLEKWKTAIRTELNNTDKPAIVIAHSFGTLASASIAAENPAQIAALFLVAPADPDKFQLAEHLPQQPLNVPGKIIASSNDPWLSESKAAYWALLWGTDFLRLKNVGHINSDSQLGVWQEGADALQGLLRKRLTTSAQQHGAAHKKNRAA